MRCYRLWAGLVAVCALVLWSGAAVAYPNYNGSPACDDCHPGFVGGFAGPLHGLHLGFVSGDCSLCHVVPGDNSMLSKCAGCHLQAGLVAHHENAGAPPDVGGRKCTTCHPGLTPGPETDIPPYYLLASSLVKNPCSSRAPSAGGEDANGDGKGLDNDGDLVYDELDPDCIAAPTENRTWGSIKALFGEE